MKFEEFWFNVFFVCFVCFVVKNMIVLSPDFPDGLYLLCSARRVRPVEYGEFSR